MIFFPVKVLVAIHPQASEEMDAAQQDVGCPSLDVSFIHLFYPFLCTRPGIIHLNMCRHSLDLKSRPLTLIGYKGGWSKYVKLQRFVARSCKGSHRNCWSWHSSSRTVQIRREPRGRLFCRGLAITGTLPAWVVRI